MKSLLIENDPVVPEKNQYSELQVLQSASGYYVGTVHTDEDGYPEPGSRDSEYFRTHEKAKAYLAMVSQVVNPQEYLRDRP